MRNKIRDHCPHGLIYTEYNTEYRESIPRQMRNKIGALSKSIRYLPSFPEHNCCSLQSKFSLSHIARQQHSWSLWKVSFIHCSLHHRHAGIIVVVFWLFVGFGTHCIIIVSALFGWQSVDHCSWSQHLPTSSINLAVIMMRTLWWWWRESMKVSEENFLLFLLLILSVI